MRKRFLWVLFPIALVITIIFCLTLFYVCIWQLDSAIFDVLADEVGWDFLMNNIWSLPLPPWNPIRLCLHDAIITFMFGLWFAFLLFGVLMFLIGYFWKGRHTQ